MIFLGKALDTIELSDLQRLIDDKVEERTTVEYKEKIYGDSDNEKRELLKDIMAMANASGGYLIIVIKEKNRVPIEILGIDDGNHAERIENACIYCVEPRLHGLRFKPVDVADGKIILIVSIPQSLNQPHMVRYKGHIYFWRRHDTLNQPMNRDEIQRAFEDQFEGLNKAERFLLQRKHHTLQRMLGDHRCLLLSLLPIFPRQDTIDVHDKQIWQLMKEKGEELGIGDTRFTLTGLRSEYENKRLEVFRNGYVEYALSWPRGENKGIHWLVAYRSCDFIQFVQRLYQIAQSFSPVQLNLAIYNARGLTISSFSLDITCIWDEADDIGPINDIFVNDLQHEAALLPKRLNDRLWEAFGLERAFIFNENGDLTEERSSRWR
ncbi:MAG: ATP-binding protein [Chloroflexi bacterium]|nr:ATP-binding protein [Chloroflexota bacterium]